MPKRPPKRRAAPETEKQAGPGEPSAKPAEPPRFAELDSDYEVLRELGRGGTAVVYLARERELGRLVAIKVMRSAYVEDEEAAARLVREARTVGALQHPNIVMLYGTRRLRDGSLALIMQYVQGRTLREEIKAHGAFTVPRAEQVLRDLGSALAHAHRRRIVHRDIKPENVYIDENGTARLSDFGIARPWGTDSNLTLPGAAIGTPAYMSPEQIEGAALDGRSDLYSLGLVGWEMLTGTRPWAGESLFGIIYKQKHEPLPALERQRPGLPRALVHAIEGALRKEPDERWPDAESFLSALQGGAAPAARVPFATGADVPFAAAHPERDPTPAQEPDADALTVKYVRPAAVPPAAPVPAPRAAGDEPEAVAEAAPAPPAPGLESLLTVGTIPEPADDPLPPEPQPSRLLPKRRSRVLVAGVAALFVGGTALLTGVSLWGSQAGESMGPANAAALPPGELDAAPASEPGPPAAVLVPTLAALGDTALAGVAGDTLAPVAVRVTGPDGRPLSGVPVRFVVLEGESTVGPASASTDADGTVRARWIPESSGAHALEVQVANADVAGIRFAASIAPRPAARLARVSREELEGTAATRLSDPLAVRVLDDRGQPVPDVRVRFVVRAGGGSIDREVRTAADGTAAARWTLGRAEEQRVVAKIAGADADSVVFRARAQPAPLAVRRTVEAGGTHSCVLAADGSAACWGGNDSGQLGDGAGARRAKPAPVRAPEPFSTISTGVSHTCAVTVSGSAYCWGANASGQLGNGATTASREPVRVNTSQRLTSVVAGMGHSCGLTGAGQLYCWGRNDQGQLGDGSRTARLAPVRAGGNRTYRSVALGWSHTCAIGTNGTAYCWGRNGAGELGDGTNRDRTAPVAVAGGHRFTALAAGSSHTCGLRADGTVLCWGAGPQGQLGNGANESSAVPVEVLAGVAFTSITAGGVHTCALARDRAAWCWGRNNYGQLGEGTFADRPQPMVVETSRRFSRISASGAHTCALSTGGEEFCWGLNVDGQLGDGTRTNQRQPVLVRRDS